MLKATHMHTQGTDMNMHTHAHANIHTGAALPPLSVPLQRVSGRIFEERRLGPLSLAQGQGEEEGFGVALLHNQALASRMKEGGLPIRFISSPLAQY